MLYNRFHQPYTDVRSKADAPSITETKAAAYFVVYLSSFNPLGVLSVTFNKRAFRSNSKRAYMYCVLVYVWLKNLIYFPSRAPSDSFLPAANFAALVIRGASMCVHAK